MKKYCIIIFILSIISSQYLYGQKYNKERCLNMAIENNTKLINSRLSEQEASLTKEEALTKYFPSVSASGLYFEANKPMVQMNMTLAEMGGVSIPIEMLENGKTASITAIQPIFAGGRIVNGNKLAKIGSDVSKLQSSLIEEEIIRNTESYFWQIVSLKEKLNTISTIKGQLEKVHSTVDVSVKAGITTRNDLLRVELKQQELESSEIKVKDGISVLKMVLGQYIGIGTDTSDFDIIDTIFCVPASPNIYFIPDREAVSRRKELVLMEKNVEANELQVKMEAGKYLPSIGAGASYIYHDFLGKDSKFGLAFASISIPISDCWGGSKAVRRLDLKRQRAVNEKDNNTELLKVEINQSWNELQQAYKQILIAEKSIASSQENLRICDNSYNVGTIALTDLLDAQTLLQQSKDLFCDACCDYQIKLTKYLQVTGQ